MRMIKRVICVLLTCYLCINTFYNKAYASTIDVSSHSEAVLGSGETKDSIFTLTDLSAITPGSQLDISATIITSEGYTWEVPIIWIDSNGNISKGVALENTKYNPVIAFFIATQYKPYYADKTYELRISDDLIGIFGGSELLSVYSELSNITYIFLGDSSQLLVQVGQDKIMGWFSAIINADANNQDAGQGGSSENIARKFLDVYCSKTALDNIDETSLYLLVYSIMYELEPQAVKILEDNFPAFKEAAQNNQLSSEIGLYVYYEKGDNDGMAAHETPDGALAYTRYDFIERDGALYFGQLIAVDVNSCILKDENDNPITNEEGKFILVNRSVELENTILHEMFHAFMNDYNRVGMTGIANADEWIYYTDEVKELQDKTMFPGWFVEGLATSVESAYQFHQYSFKFLRYEFDYSGETASGDFGDAYKSDTFLEDYTSIYFYLPNGDGTTTEEELYFDIETSDKLEAKYVAGYLACLYLGEMAAINAGYGSAIREDGTVDNEIIKNGVNIILEDLHNGQTLDSLINEISNGAYENTSDFEAKFIKGNYHMVDYTDGSGQYKEYEGDASSIDFCVTLLNQMNEVETDGEIANGSILTNFDNTEETLMVEDYSPDTNEFVIAESNDFADSDVEQWSDGGTSRSGAEENTDNAVSYSSSEGGGVSNNPVAAKEDYTNSNNQAAAKLDEDNN